MYLVGSTGGADINRWQRIVTRRAQSPFIVVAHKRNRQEVKKEGAPQMYQRVKCIDDWIFASTPSTAGITNPLSLSQHSLYYMALYTCLYTHTMSIAGAAVQTKRWKDDAGRVLTAALTHQQQRSEANKRPSFDGRLDVFILYILYLCVCGIGSLRP